MKIVITGGGGFIGFKLAKALLARGSLAGADGTAQKIAPGFGCLPTRRGRPALN